MKTLIGLFGFLFVVAIAVFIAGLLLPRDHVAVRSASLAASPESVWTVVTQVGRYPTWRRDVDSVQVLETRGGRLEWREISGGDRLRFEAVTAERPSRFVARIADKGIPFGGSWDYRIVPEGSGSRLTITENGQVYNPVFRFISQYFIGHTATLDKYLGDIAAVVGGRDAPRGPNLPPLHGDS